MQPSVPSPTDTGATRRLSPEEERAWQGLGGLLATLPAALDAQLRRDAGLNTFEYHILLALARAPERCLTFSRLSVLTQGSLSRLSHAVGRLEQAGWVERVSLGHARRSSARLTDAGSAKVRQSAPGHVGEIRRLVIDALTPQQLEALGEAARLVVRHSDPELDRLIDQLPV